MVYSGDNALIAALPSSSFSPTPPIISADGADRSGVFAPGLVVPIPNAEPLPPAGRLFRTLQPLEVYGLLEIIDSALTS